MYSTTTTQLSNVSGYETHLLNRETALAITNAEFITLLGEDHTFRKFYNSYLGQSPYQAFYWEHPVIGQSNLNDPYRFAVIDSKSLATAKANHRPFAAYFDSTDKVVVFENIGKDAILVVPNPLTIGDYQITSLAQLVRTNDPDTIDKFWQLIGQQLLERIYLRSVYLNTAGDGVHWCHARLDSRPKYYKHRAYTT